MSIKHEQCSGAQNTYVPFTCRKLKVFTYL